MTNISVRDKNKSTMDSSMVYSSKGQLKPVRSATYFQGSTHTRNRQVRKDDSSYCDQSNINNNRPKSTDSVVYHLIPNTTKQGSPRLKPNNRGSPTKDGSLRFSPTLGGLYAGAKFSEPPAPTSLPKPPSHWTSIMSRPFIGVANAERSPHDCSKQLKILLNVQA